MRAQQFIQLRQFLDEIRLIAPREAAARMNIDAFGCEPLDAARETKSAAHTRQRAETIAQQRPVAAFRGEANVVMRLAVMNVEAKPRALLQRVFEITRDFRAGIILEQLRRPPLHPASGEQLLCRNQRAAETFEQ